MLTFSSTSRGVFTYLTGLLSVAERATCAALVRMQRGISHDGLTRLLQRETLDWQTLLSSIVASIVGRLSTGYLIIDDTVIDKTFARAIEGIAWVYSSKENRSILGLSVVVLCWSNGTVTVPLGLRIWRKDDGKSKVDLAVELLRWVKKLPCFSPQYVVFDSWYGAERLMATIERFGWTWVTQLKRNRRLNGVQLRALHRHPYWMEEGTLEHSHHVLVVRHGKKFFATNDTSWGKKQLLEIYGTRWPIETMFRVLHNQLGLGACEARTIRAQAAHITLCCMAYVTLERERQSRSRTHYALRREYRFHPERAERAVNSMIFQGA
ncbi:transposase [Candidatus Kaiserbacteria bacterium]|nr:transposase [Candidatus Kaiserbacteria bacterium]